MNPNDHIPTAEIEQDIADTLAEIATMQREEKGLRIIGDKWSVMRADARKSGIKEREEFVAKLRTILAEREFAEEQHGT